jgi:hypothetical protein
MLRPGLGVRKEYYNTREITIPRCAVCQRIDKLDSMSMLFGIFALLFAFAGVAFYFGMPRLWWLVFVLPTVVVGFIWIRVLRFLARAYREAERVETSWWSHPEVARRRKDGWNVGKQKG